MWIKPADFREPQNLDPTRKAPEFCADGRENGAKLRSLSRWRELELQYTKHQPKLQTSSPKFGNGTE